MPKAKPSETEVPALSAQEKSDLRSRWAALPKEERDAFIEEVWPGRLGRARQAGRHRGHARWQAEKYRLSQANQTIEDTLRNLDTETDDNKRASHILAFAERQAQDYANRQAQVNLESLPLPPLPPSSNRV